MECLIVIYFQKDWISSPPQGFPNDARPVGWELGFGEERCNDPDLRLPQPEELRFQIAAALGIPRNPKEEGHLRRHAQASAGRWGIVSVGETDRIRQVTRP